LIVIDSNGKERHGNMGLSPGFDEFNNVEQVVWAEICPGEAKIKIQAIRVATHDPQPFAFAWRIS